MEVKLKAGTFNIEEVPVKNGMEVLTSFSELTANVLGDEDIMGGIKEALGQNKAIDVVKVGVKIIPKLLKNYYEDTINLVALASGIDKETLENEGMSKLMKVITAIVKENDYKEWQEILKNLIEVIRKQKA